MGLIKPEFSGGAQAVTESQVNGYAGQDGSCYSNANATGYAAFTSRSDSMFDAAVSNNVEDTEIDTILRKQEEQVYEASMRLSFLESRHQAVKGKDLEGPTSDTIVRRITKSIGPLPEPTVKAPMKMPFDKILKLLLASLKGSFAANIPRQKCASPVPYNTTNEGYHPMFYVSKERKLAKHDESFDGIPVRYQGFTKSTVWYSPENPRWGIVARRMQHQSRMKQKSANEESMASKAALFFHVFEGFSYVLIERTNVEEEVNKGKLASYVVENAAKFVQIWPISKTKGLNGASKNGGSTPKANVPCSSPSDDHVLSRSSSCSNIQTVDHATIQLNRKRSFEGSDGHHFSRESKRQFPSEDMFSFSFQNATVPEEFEIFPQRHTSIETRSLGSSSVHSSNHSVASHHVANPPSLHRQHSQQSHHSQHSLASHDHVQGQHRLSHHSVSSSSSSSVGDRSPHGHGDDLAVFSSDHLLEEALLSGEEDYESRGSDETTLQDMFIEESDDGFGGSYDPLGLMLAENIFKTFCENMQGTEFAREYERIQSLLFNKNFSSALRLALDNKDPRIQQSFMYPEFGSPAAQFVANTPVAAIRMIERSVGSGDFAVDTCDEKAKEILHIDLHNSSNIFEALDKSDMSYVMGKYYMLLNKPSSFWIQRVVTLGNGQNAVIRGFSSISGNQATGRQSWSVHFQDVSFLYPDVLLLPAADVLTSAA